jgi:hypothetical protein
MHVCSLTPVLVSLRKLSFVTDRQLAAMYNNVQAWVTTVEASTAHIQAHGAEILVE